MVQTNSPKLYPYHYEYERLGGIDTKEGREYGRKHKDEMVKEYGEKMKIMENRFRLGGDKKIHILDGI